VDESESQNQNFTYSRSVGQSVSQSVHLDSEPLIGTRGYILALKEYFGVVFVCVMRMFIHF
jgi:hypothetical protein